MSDFLQRFGQQHADGTYYFGAYRQGAITALLCGGAAVGSLIAGRLADIIGRKFSISLFAFWTAVGVIIEISSMTSWGQFAAGRFVDGIGIGALSVVVRDRSERRPWLASPGAHAGNRRGLRGVRVRRRARAARTVSGLARGH